MKHRSETEIIACILEAISQSRIQATQTRIMYGAFLSYAQLKGYLSSLVEKYLIEYHKEQQFYTITEKGLRFLQIYNQLDQLQVNNIFKGTEEWRSVNSTHVEEEGYDIGNGSGGGRSGNSLTVPEQQQVMMMNNAWKCDKCGMHFARKGQLKEHKEEVHSY